MAGVSMNDIKARIKSVNSTMQITKAMELVATSKLRRAKMRAEQSRAYGEIATEAMKKILLAPAVADSPYTRPSEGKKVCYVVIAGDRGLAGGFNVGIFRTVQSLGLENAYVIPVGKKAVEYYRGRAECLTEAFSPVDNLSVGAAMKIARLLIDGFDRGTFDRVVLVYTRFVSMISQVPTHTVLLPLERGAGGQDPMTDEDISELLSSLLPQYLGGMIYGAIAESLAAECGARRTAMNAANKNAEEMIVGLNLSYNRARQAMITQEITEIVSGAEAL
ncbi:MAG: ATP synthase F1 subunit gamma [Clostridia bacterium]|nr:ATP synthase F1 subunit gamma [Clostridia bacterium]